MQAISIIMLNLTFKRQTVFRFLSIKHPQEKPKNAEGTMLSAEPEALVKHNAGVWFIFSFENCFFLKTYLFQCPLLQYFLLTN